MKLSQIFGLFLATTVAGTTLPNNTDHSSTCKQGRCQLINNASYADVEATGFAQDYKTVRLPGGRTYRYVHIPPTCADKPYVLFLHGWPSSSYDWRHQINYFKDKGYGIIVPDLLGYGGTDKPTEIEAYRAKTMAQEIIELLDCEKVQTVIGIGHDWGSFFLGRIYNWFPERFTAVSFIDVWYFPPGTGLNEETVLAINKNTTVTLGYANFGYFLFFREPETGALMDANVDRLFDLFYSSDPSVWPTEFIDVGAVERYLKEGRQAPESDYVTKEEQAIHDNIILSNGGYNVTLNWYRVSLSGLNEIDDKGIPANRSIIEKPLLFISALQDPIALAQAGEAQTRATSTDYRIKQVDTGHWAQLEARDEVNQYLEEFFIEVQGESA